MTNIEKNREKINALFGVSFQLRVLQEKSNSLRADFRNSKNPDVSNQIIENDKAIETLKNTEIELTDELNEKHNIRTQFIIKSS